MEFDDFATTHWHYATFPVKSNQLEFALKIYPHVGTKPFSGTRATEITKHPNLAALLSGLRGGGVLRKVPAVTQVHHYQFTQRFIDRIALIQERYEKEVAAQ